MCFLCQNFPYLKIMKSFFYIFFWNKSFLLHNLVFNVFILKEWIEERVSFHFFPSVDNELSSNYDLLKKLSFSIICNFSSIIHCFHVCMSLFLGFLFCSIDSLVYFCTKTRP